MKKNSILLCLFILTLSAGLTAWDFVPALDLTGGGAYSYLPDESKGKNNSFGGEAALATSFMMNTDWLPNLWIIPTLTSNFSTTAQPLNVEDERFLFSKWFDLYFSYGFNYEFNDVYEWRFRGFSRKDYSMQTNDETFGKGLYDYTDAGMYFENVWNFDYYKNLMEFTIGYKYIDRQFPNYKTLISSANLNDILGSGSSTPNSYTKEKDLYTHSFYLSDQVQWGDSNWNTMLGFSFDYLPYREQKVIDKTGDISDEPRVDRLAVITLEVPYYASGASGVEFDYSLSIRSTNQNYYDNMGDSDFLNDTFVEKYYNYYEHVIKAVLNYEFPYKLLSDYQPVATLGLSFDIVQYEKRFAKDKAGNYKAELQQDSNYTLSFDVKQKIMEYWSYYAGVGYTKYSSNMQWEAYGIYNYSYLTVNFGTGLSF